MTAAQMEIDLKIYSWGAWARPRYAEMLGVKPQSWAAMMKEGYRETKARLDPITDQEAEAIDKRVAGFSNNLREVMVALYVAGCSIRQAARYLNRSKQSIMQDRDFALGRLYGAIMDSRV